MYLFNCETKKKKQTHTPARMRAYSLHVVVSKLKHVLKNGVKFDVKSFESAEKQVKCWKVTTWCNRCKHPCWMKGCGWLELFQ